MFASSRLRRGKSITSFAIVRIDAAPSTAKYHDRMPVPLNESRFDDWMRGTPEQAAEMMEPCAAEIEVLGVAANMGNMRHT